MRALPAPLAAPRVSVAAVEPSLPALAQVCAWPTAVSVATANVGVPDSNAAYWIQSFKEFRMHTMKRHGTGGGIMAALALAALLSVSSAASAMECTASAASVAPSVPPGAPA